MFLVLLEKCLEHLIFTNTSYWNITVFTYIHKFIPIIWLSFRIVKLWVYLFYVGVQIHVIYALIMNGQIGIRISGEAVSRRMSPHANVTHYIKHLRYLHFATVSCALPRLEFANRRMSSLIVSMRIIRSFTNITHQVFTCGLQTLKSKNNVVYYFCKLISVVTFISQEINEIMFFDSREFIHMQLLIMYTKPST